MITKVKLLLSYCETILFPVGIYLFKVNNKNTRKRYEIIPKLTKNLPKKRRLHDLSDLDIHSSSCEEVVLVIVMLNFKFL